jgi:hypothetical protein
MSDYLLLGPVRFEKFELPPRIFFGGAQRMAVHALPGGVRVIDALGRDDADIVWSGAFSGSDAAERARLLDLLRAEGGVWPLAWDAFAYEVVIAAFEAEYQHANWVPYRVVCKVVLDLAQAAVLAVADLAGSVLADLTQAGPLAGGAVAALGAAGGAVPGTAAFAATLGSAGGAVQAIAANMQQAGGDLLSAGDPATAAQAAGSLASLADAQGFAGRALSNLTLAL